MVIRDVTGVRCSSRQSRDATEVDARHGRFSREPDVLALKSPRARTDEFFSLDGVRDGLASGRTGHPAGPLGFRNRVFE
jgi:hypothetical protein